MIDELIPPHGDEHAEDTPDRAPSAPVSSIERVNGLLGRMHRLQHDVDAYDALHRAEIDKLQKRRETVLGPLLRRIERIEATIDDFAVASYLHFGDVKHRVPNGDITSRPVTDTIDKDDNAVHEWLKDCAPTDTFELRPWIDMKKLRAWLAARVADGHLQRMVSRPATGDQEPEFFLVDESKGWPWPLDPGFVGVWFWTSDGVAEFDCGEGDILPGVTWSPNGTQGSGRNFKVKT